MKKIPKVTLVEKRLIRRYLLWCYKTTREEIERIDRKFTQLIVDYFVLDDLTGAKKKDQDCARSQIEAFKAYISNKESAAYNERFADIGKKTAKPEYLYLKMRLSAIEKAVKRFLGKRDLDEIARLFEEEMTKRILESREHR